MGTLLALTSIGAWWAPLTAQVEPAQPGPRALQLDISAQTTVQMHWVLPEEADSAAQALRAPHFAAVDPGVARRGQLFVFMGSFVATPADVMLIVTRAAANGYHAVGLSYPKPARLDTVCMTNSDDACFEQARQAVIDGGDDTSPVTVAPADSIVRQLAGLLAYLASQHPTEGWAAYLDEDMPRWSAIHLAGHSEGGGHAAMIARDHEVARLCLFETPVDLIDTLGGQRRLPPWIQPDGATPPERTYGFEHLHTSTSLFAGYQGAWSVWGLDVLGPTVDVDSSEPPYDGSHHLTTDAEPGVNDDTPNLVHRSLVEDRLTPKTPSGEPQFAPVWDYACLS